MFVCFLKLLINIAAAGALCIIQFHAAGLCDVGWKESRDTVILTLVDFLYIENSKLDSALLILFSYSAGSFSIVNRKWKKQSYL